MHRILQSLKDYEFSCDSDKFRQASNHRQIARLMKQAPCSPFTIIIEEELLDPSHFWDKRYVKITTEQIMSELDMNYRGLTPRHIFLQVDFKGHG